MEYVLIEDENVRFETDDMFASSDLDDIVETALERDDDEPEVYYGERCAPPSFDLREHLYERLNGEFSDDNDALSHSLDQLEDSIAEAQKIVDDVLADVAAKFWEAGDRRVDPARVVAAIEAAKARAAMRQSAPIDAMEGEGF